MLLLPRTGVSQEPLEAVPMDGQDRGLRRHADGLLQFISE